MDFQQICANIMRHLGGIGNIKYAEACATKLRLGLVREDQVRLEELKSLQGVYAALFREDELHILLGKDSTYQLYLEMNKQLKNRESQQNRGQCERREKICLTSFLVSFKCLGKQLCFQLLYYLPQDFY